MKIQRVHEKELSEFSRKHTMLARVLVLCIYLFSWVLIPCGYVRCLATENKAAADRQFKRDIEDFWEYLPQSISFIFLPVIRSN
jgi:hypothetical protein